MVLVELRGCQRHAPVLQILPLLHADHPAAATLLGLGLVQTGCGQGAAGMRGIRRGLGGHVTGGRAAERTRGGSIGGRAGGRALQRLALQRPRSCDAGKAAACWVQRLLLHTGCLALPTDKQLYVWWIRVLLVHSLTVTHIRNVRRVVTSVTAVLLTLQHSMVYR
jgi:hypothetical protein